jgi:predicted transcriptional regulator
MNEKILYGRDRQIDEIPQSVWEHDLIQIPQHAQARLNFMSDAHHQVRYLVVKQLVNRQKPVEPQVISEELNLPLEKVRIILDELERNLFFLVRNAQGAVAWAYPVTVDVTPHRLNFSSGERLYGA